MAYHPLANDTGGTADDRRAEADRILKMLYDHDAFDDMTAKEQEFINDMDNGPVTPKQLFWLRDIKSKYLE